MGNEWSGDAAPGGGQPDDVLDLRELEDELCRLTGILGVRIVPDRVGRPIEVHVLADHSKPAKQTVRDVRAVAQTVFGIELPRSEHRARVGSINVEAVGVRAEVRVVLVDGDREHTGYAEGSVASLARAQLVATAALDAVRQLEPAAEAVHVATAEITRLGPSRVAVVTVVYVDPPVELVVSGSAVVRRDRDDAVVRALLDATNRRLSRLERGRASR